MQAPVHEKKTCQTLESLPEFSVSAGISCLTGSPKDLVNAHKHFFWTLFHAPSTKNAIRTAVSEIGESLTFLELFQLTQMALESRESKLFYIYYENILKHFQNKWGSEDEERARMKLAADARFMKKISVPQADWLQLALEELKKPSANITAIYVDIYLEKAILEVNARFAESLYYYGLCQLYGVFGQSNLEKGLTTIQGSANNQWPQAIELIQALTNPQKAFAILVKAGDEAYAKGLHHFAKYHYLQALDQKRAPNNRKPEIQSKQALCDWNMGYRDQAYAVFVRILNSNPNHPDILEKILEYHVAKDNLDQAVDLLKSNHGYIARLNRAPKAKGSAIETAYAAYQFCIGREMLHQNNLREGFKHIKESANLNYPSAKLYLGICYLEGWGTAQDFALAGMQFQMSPESPEASYYLGIIATYGLGEILDQNMASGFFDLVKQEPLAAEYLQKNHSVSGLIELGDKACEQRMYQVALCHYQRAVEKENNHAEALYKVGICHFKKNNLHAADNFLQQALKQKPDYTEAILARLKCLVQLNKLEEAVTLTEQHESLYTSHIMQYARKEKWKKTLCIAFDQHQQSKPKREKKKPVVKLTKSFSPESIKIWLEKIDLCENKEQFLSIVDAIQAENTPKKLLESLGIWLSRHPECRDDLLQILDSKGGFFQKYKLVWEQIPVEKSVIEPEILSTDVPQIPRNFSLWLTLFRKVEPKKLPLNNDHEAINNPPPKPQKIASRPTDHFFKPAEPEIDGEIHYREVEYPFNYKVTRDECSYMDPVFGLPAYEGRVAIAITLNDRTLRDSVHHCLGDLTQKIIQAGIHYRQEFNPQAYTAEGNQIVLTLVTGSQENYWKIQKMVADFGKQVDEFRESYAFSNPGFGR